MKKALKVFLVLVALVLLLAGGLLVAVRVFFPPEKIRALVLEHLSQRLHREVRLQQVSIGLLSGLSLTDLEISERPTFKQGTFLSMRRFSVHVALRPLLRKQVVVRSVLLSEPTIMVIRQADGKTFNFSDLLPGTTTQLAIGSREDFVVSALPVKGQPEPFVFNIAAADLQNGVLRFVDRSPAGMNAELRKLNVTLKDVSQDQPISFRVSLDAMSKPFKGSASAAGSLDLAKDVL